MPTEFLEHANLTVADVDRAAHFLMTALPTWRIRGGGHMDWFGQPRRWLHVGTDLSYIALQDGGQGQGLDWRGNAVGTKHLGLVVPSLPAVVDRLAAAGLQPDHGGAPHPYRRNVYFQDNDGTLWEFIEYLSEVSTERNAYPA